jgi:hypothetical protein
MKTFPWMDFLRKHPMFSSVRDAKKLEVLLEDSASTERSVWAKTRLSCVRARAATRSM